jgi:putative transposase
MNVHPVLRGDAEASQLQLPRSEPDGQPDESSQLVIPDNITLVPLPAKAPELNPVENVWQFLRENWLSNRIFTSYPDIIDHCCAAWNKLTDQPWLIMSIGLRDWAHRF